MSLFNSVEIESSNTTVGFNTGTLFDTGVGKYEVGMDGRYYLDAGLGCHITGVVGMNGMYKSTIAVSLAMRILGIYKEAELLVVDSEDAISKDKNRVLRFADDFKISPDRIAWIGGDVYDLDKFLEFLLIVCKNKMEKKKDYRLTTPFVDMSTMKNLEVWAPTIIVIDSISEFISAGEDELLESAGIGDKKTNTIHMVDGNKKTIFQRKLRRLCQQYGLIVIETAHYDKKMNMDMYAPNPKETQFGKQDYTVKHAGSNFKFLTGIYARTQASVLQDSNKQALYEFDKTADRDINEVLITIERCKTNNAGTIIPLVVSQTYGLLNTVSYYHYLRENDYYCLNGNKMKHNCILRPEVTLSRNTVRSLITADDKLRRALEICAQIKFIKNTWTYVPFDLSLEPMDLLDKLTSDKNKAIVEKITSSRGYWLPISKAYKDAPEYMSIFDIVEDLKQLK